MRGRRAPFRIAKRWSTAKSNLLSPLLSLLLLHKHTSNSPSPPEENHRSKTAIAMNKTPANKTAITMNKTVITMNNTAITMNNTVITMNKTTPTNPTQYFLPDYYHQHPIIAGLRLSLSSSASNLNLQHSPRDGAEQLSQRPCNEHTSIKHIFV